MSKPNNYEANTEDEINDNAGNIVRVSKKKKTKPFELSKSILNPISKEISHYRSNLPRSGSIVSNLSASSSKNPISDERSKLTRSGSLNSLGYSSEFTNVTSTNLSESESESENETSNERQSTSTSEISSTPTFQITSEIPSNSQSATKNASTNLNLSSSKSTSTPITENASASASQSNITTENLGSEEIEIENASVKEDENVATSVKNENLNLEPIEKLLKIIRDEIADIDEDSGNQLIELARLREEERKKLEIERLERVKQAEQQRLERESQEQLKREKERLRKENEERERQEEIERLKKEAAERERITREKKEREEAERKETERKKIEELNTLKSQYDSKVKQLGNMAVTDSNMTSIMGIDDLQQILNSNHNAVNLPKKIKIIEKIIEIINRDKPSTIGDIKKLPEYNQILSDIIFIMKSFENKVVSQQNLITEYIGADTEDSGKNKKLFDKIKKIYDDLKILLEKFILNNHLDDTSLNPDEYNIIMTYITKINSEDENSAPPKIKDNLSDLFEIIVGTARVAVRIKPKKIDNTTIEKPYTNFREYFNALSSAPNNVIPSVITRQRADERAAKKAARKTLTASVASPEVLSKTSAVVSALPADSPAGKAETKSGKAKTPYKNKPSFMGSTKSSALRAKFEGSSQIGGYNYPDILTVNNNYIKIGDNCNDTTILENVKTHGYGPFYSIYPPQYNNFHIYYNMFGLNPFNSEKIIQLSEDDKKLNTKYNELLQNDKLPPLKDDRVFDTKSLNNKSHNLMKKLESGGSVVIFGYGFSGSGKTYALIEGLASDEHYDPSILKQFIQENVNSIQSVEFLELYPLGISHNPHNALSLDNNNKIISSVEGREVSTSNDISKYASESNITLNYEEITTSSLYDPIKNNNSDLTYEKISNRIQLLERHRFWKLRILATPNNDKSSRSFLQITINLKPLTNGKQPKLVLFDMPGTENTVRIKTQFLGEDLFSKLQKRIIPTPVNLNIAIYKPDTVGNNVKYMITPNGNYQFYSHTINDKDTSKQKGIVFKNFIMQRTIFSKCNILMADNDAIIACDGLEFAAFINGLDIKSIPNKFIESYSKIPINKEIIFLTDELYISIVKKFIGFLLEKDDKNMQKYFSVGNTNNFCKISSVLSDEDNNNIQNVFNLKIDLVNENIVSDLFIHFFNYTKFISDGKTKTKIIDFQDNLYDFAEIFDNSNDELKLKKANVKNINGKFIKSNKTIYFANPLIKYIYLILNYIYTHYLKIKEGDYSKSNPEISSPDQIFYRAATFFIYKYINFIVNQGRSIVTNLEHLKFFFLTRTGAIADYNINNPKKSFACITDDCIDLITNSENKVYTNATPIKIKNGTELMQIEERINYGYMKVYGLIDILQVLSSCPKLNDCEILENGKNGYTLNLLKPKQTLKNTYSEASLLGAIFIMFANYKIFLDNDIDEESIESAKSKLDTLCKAAIDTANFTQSISSTSINKKETESAPIPTGSKKFLDTDDFKKLFVVPVSGGNRKFDLKELLNNNNKNKKPRTHRNLSFKNKKNRVFHNKTKKNI